MDSSEVMAKMLPRFPLLVSLRVKAGKQSVVLNQAYLCTHSSIFQVERLAVPHILTGTHKRS